MDGVLTENEEDRLNEELKAMLIKKTAVIPPSVLQPLMSFMTYTLKGAIHLNKLVVGCGFDNINSELDPATKKRCRIVERLSQGLTSNMKRRFAYSKLKHALGDLTNDDISTQVNVLEANGVVVRPTHRSVELVRELPPATHVYMTEHCGFDEGMLITVLQNNMTLTD